MGGSRFEQHFGFTQVRFQRMNRRLDDQLDSDGRGQMIDGFRPSHQAR